MKWLGTARKAVVAVWTEITTKVRIYAQILAGPANLAVVCWVILIVAKPSWGRPEQQLQILSVLGILSSLTNAVVVIALSQVRVNAAGPGGTRFNVGTDDDEEPPKVVTTTTTEVVPATPKPSVDAPIEDKPPWQR